MHTLHTVQNTQKNDQNSNQSLDQKINSSLKMKDTHSKINTKLSEIKRKRLKDVPKIRELRVIALA